MSSVLRRNLDQRQPSSGNQTIAAGPGDFLFVPRGNRHGFTNFGAMTGRLLTFMFPGGHEQFWLDVGDDPTPGEYPTAWGPDMLAQVAEERAHHQVTVMPERP